MFSYQSIAQECASFYSDATLREGIPCKMSAANSVDKAAKDEAFIGIVAGQRDTLVNVIVRGFVTVHYSGNAPADGRTGLVAGENSTVAASTTGPVYLVVASDTVNKTVTFLL